MKKIVLVSLISLLIMSVVYAVSFTDVSESHWAYSYIQDMQSKGFIKGYEDGTFKPENEVTREEFAQMYYNMAKKEAESEKIRNYFDVPQSRWSYNAVQLVGDSIKETSDGYIYFYPTRPIQRQEVAKVLNDQLGLTVKEGKIPFMDDGVSNDYVVMRTFLKNEYGLTDTSSIANEYLWDVCVAYENKLMNGVTETEFSPEGILTRAQAATLLYRVVGGASEEPAKQPAEQPTEQSDVDLNLAFLKLENNKTNLIYSPLSIKYGLKMLSEGANGKTKTEIDNLVKNVNLTKYDNIKDVLSLANSVFIRDSYKEYVKDEFTNTLMAKYNAEVKIDAFANAKNVNDWISDKTFGIIKNMIKDDLVQKPELQMMLINALAIDMEWVNQFPAPKTTGRDFTKENGTKINATMMRKDSRSDEDFYYMDDNVTAVMMNLKEYEGNKLQFVAIMPNKNLSEYVSKVDMNDINTIISKASTARSHDGGINIFMPKFSFEYDLGFKEDLKKLGMVEAFDKYNADFTNMTTNPDGLCVGEALHKAKIDFTEKGVKAAAVTVFAMFEKASISMDKPLDLVIDKPFLFIIRDTKTGEVWFTGTVYEPNLWENEKADYVPQEPVFKAL